MKIGVLEFESEQFIRDVLGKLGGLECEYIKCAGSMIPAKNSYRVIIDRLSFQDSYLKELVSLAAMNGCYVINNPFVSRVSSKILHHDIISRLGMKQPKSMFLTASPTESDIRECVREPDWEFIKREFSLPCILKPCAGYAWDDVYTVASYRELENLYNALKGRYVLLLQEKIEYTKYFRVFCVNKKDVLVSAWEPRPFGMGKYIRPDQKSIEKFCDFLREATIKINKAIDFDFNAVEWCIDEEGEPCVIEALNEVPDIIKGSMPDDYYWWLVDRFSALVREKFSSNEKNRTPFTE